MKQTLFDELKISNRDEVVAFLKKLWNNEQTNCPKCGYVLELLHKKAKKSNCDWKCKSCGTIYRTIQILDRLNSI